jgi:hypothetical protein
MTSKELHAQKIVPLRLELQKLEAEYRKLYRKECGEKIGAEATCENCAFSCTTYLTDHNGCMGGKCTCCNSWCFKWIPENEVSAFLRKNYPWDSSKYNSLEDIFGCDFLKKCDTHEKAQPVMEVLKLLAKFDGKDEEA